MEHISAFDVHRDISLLKKRGIMPISPFGVLSNTLSDKILGRYEAQIGMYYPYADLAFIKENNADESNTAVIPPVVRKEEPSDIHIDVNLTLQLQNEMKQSDPSMRVVQRAVHVRQDINRQIGLGRTLRPRVIEAPAKITPAAAQLGVRELHSQGNRRLAFSEVLNRAQNADITFGGMTSNGLPAPKFRTKYEEQERTLEKIALGEANEAEIASVFGKEIAKTIYLQRKEIASRMQNAVESGDSSKLEDVIASISTDAISMQKAEALLSDDALHSNEDKTVSSVFANGSENGLNQNESSYAAYPMAGAVMQHAKGNEETADNTDLNASMHTDSGRKNSEVVSQNIVSRFVKLLFGTRVTSGEQVSESTDRSIGSGTHSDKEKHGIPAASAAVGETSQKKYSTGVHNNEIHSNAKEVLFTPSAQEYVQHGQETASENLNRKENAEDIIASLDGKITDPAGDTITEASIAPVHTSYLEEHVPGGDTSVASAEGNLSQNAANTQLAQHIAQSAIAALGDMTYKHEDAKSAGVLDDANVILNREEDQNGTVDSAFAGNETAVMQDPAFHEELVLQKDAAQAEKVVSETAEIEQNRQAQQRMHREMQHAFASELSKASMSAMAITQNRHADRNTTDMSDSAMAAASVAANTPQQIMNAVQDTINTAAKTPEYKGVSLENNMPQMSDFPQMSNFSQLDNHPLMQMIGQREGNAAETLTADNWPAMDSLQLAGVDQPVVNAAGPSRYESSLGIPDGVHDPNVTSRLLSNMSYRALNMNYSSPMANVSRQVEKALNKAQMQRQMRSAEDNDFETESIIYGRTSSSNDFGREAQITLENPYFNQMAQSPMTLKNSTSVKDVEMPKPQPKQPSVRMSDAEIRRTADKVFNILKEKIRMERRSGGLR